MDDGGREAAKSDRAVDLDRGGAASWMAKGRCRWSFSRRRGVRRRRRQTTRVAGSATSRRREKHEEEEENNCKCEYNKISLLYVNTKIYIL